MTTVRAPAVAGMFYPREAGVLASEITEFLDQAGGDRLAPGFPKILVVPHAGFVYSGPVAGHGYDLLRPARGIVRRVVLLGPCHRVPVRGLALPGADAFDTPLGRIPVDRESLERLRGLPQVLEMPATHRQEHALEVQLPFLQQVLGDFTLVPFVVGAARAQEVAQVLETLWGDEQTLVVISTDLSHYHSYAEARSMDGATAQAILGFDTGIDHDHACGATPLTGALMSAKRAGLEGRMLDLRNSGDTAGGKSQVVGYGSFAFEAPSSGYGEAHGRELVSIARRAIGDALGLAGGESHAASAVPAGWLREHRASFVTLTKDGELRGCIGSLEAHRALGEDVAANALAAAFQDPRFAGLTAREFENLEIEVSALSRPAPIAFEDHASLVRELVPGEDGLILEHGSGRARRRGTFLPQVWESVRSPEDFLMQLKRKAGLPADTRTTACTVRRYRVRKWHESEFGDE